jgi:hypothetical protein
MKKMHVSPLTRRDFVRNAVGTTVGVSVLGAVGETESGEVAGASRVVVVRDQNALQEDNTVRAPVLEKMFEQTLVRLTGQKTLKDAWLSLVKPDDVIGFVPTFASTRGHNPNHTHQELVNVVEASLLEAGFAKDRVRNVQGDAEFCQKCTALVNLPALKAHWLTGIGTVLKNYIMFSARPSSYHNENNVKLGEIWNLPSVKGKTKLVLVDALRPLCDRGPQSDPRYMWAYGGLVAGTDPVAVETICLRIINNKREALHGEPWPLSPPPLCVAAADEQYHLGTSKMSEIRVESFGWTQDMLIG